MSVLNHVVLSTTRDNNYVKKVKNAPQLQQHDLDAEDYNENDGKITKKSGNHSKLLNSIMTLILRKIKMRVKS